MLHNIPGIKRYFAPEGEGGAGASSTTTENPTTASTNDVLAVLKHDPFPGGEAPKGDNKTGAKASGKGAKTPAKAAGTAPSGTDGQSADGSAEGADPVKAAASSDPEKDALKQSLTHATELLDAYKNRGKAEPAPASGGKVAAGEGADEGPKYSFNIPDQLVTALTSEDPAVFKQGLAGMATGVALGVHQQMVAQLPKIIEGLLAQSIPKYVQPALESYNSRKSIFDDFYGTYKELNNPKLYPTIAQITQEVMEELKTDKWSPAVRDTVAKRTKEFLRGIMGGAVPPLSDDVATSLAGKGNGAAGQPRMFGGNNSRGATQVNDATQQDVIDTLFGGEF